MKNKIFAFLLLAIFSFTFLPIKPSEPEHLKILSNTEMSHLHGGDCDPAVGVALGALMLSTAGTPWWFAAFAAWLIWLSECENSNSGGGSGGGNPPGSECINQGGTPDGYENCQSGGGQWLGNNCCLY